MNDISKNEIKRFNAKFKIENYNYLKIISHIENISMTEYLDYLLEDDRRKREDIIANFNGLIMKRFRIEVFFDIHSYNTTVEAKTGFEAIIKLCNHYTAENDNRQNWPMRAIELKPVEGRW